MTQRWNRRKQRFRPLGEVINTSRYEIAPISTDNEAKDFVTTHHYSGTYPAARFRFGLYEASKLAGVAVFSHPVNDRVLTSVFPGEPTESVELGRFVLLDSVPSNGETWFLGHVFRLLKKAGIIGVVSFSDPEPRTTREGHVIFPGHVGIIYQAHNAAFLGRGTARKLIVLPDGNVFSGRAIQKIRKQEQGWQYACDQLIRFGAPPPRCGDPRQWLQTWLPVFGRSMPHPGNFKYAWSLDRALKLDNKFPYPKR